MRHIAGSSTSLFPDYAQFSVAFSFVHSFLLGMSGRKATQSLHMNEESQWILPKFAFVDFLLLCSVFPLCMSGHKATQVATLSLLRGCHCVPCSPADFRSIELRLLAHLSDDPVLLNTLNSRQSSDVFILLASEWYIANSVASVECHAISCLP